MKIHVYGNSAPLERWLKIKLPEHEVGDSYENPDMVIGIARCSLGGVPDPLAALDDAIARGSLPIALVVAGKDGGAIERAQMAGVADECILKGERITGSELLQAINEAIQKDIRPEPRLIFSDQAQPVGLQPVATEEPVLECGPKSGDMPQLHANPVVNWDLLLPYKGRIIVITGPAGGVGRTTLAASLMAYLKGQGESVAGLDLANSLKQHLGNPALHDGDGGYPWAETRWGEVWQLEQNDLEGIAVVIGQLAQKGKWVIIDAPPGLAPWQHFAHVVWVVGSTLRQLGDRDSVPGEALLVTSRVAEDPQMWAAVVEDALGRAPDVVIEDDAEGCRTTEAEMSPAIEPGMGRGPGSPAIAAGVGRLAALLSFKGVM